MADCDDSKRRPKRKLGSFMIVSVLSAIAFLIFWQNHPDISRYLRLLEAGLSFLEEDPWALITVMATLPGFGFPNSPVLVLFGVVIAPNYGMPAAVVLAIAAQTLCSIWTYALSYGPLKVLLLRYVMHGQSLPEMSEHNMVRLGLILRLTPGIPYVLQNILLGILGMRFRDYLLVSIPTTSLWTACFVITGGAIFKGQLWWAITGIVILIVVILATRMWSRKNPADVR